MLDAVVLLGALGVVEAVERAYQIPGDAADAVELHRRVPVMDADVLAIDVKRQRLQLPVGVLVVGALDIASPNPVEEPDLAASLAFGFGDGVNFEEVI